MDDILARVNQQKDDFHTSAVTSRNHHDALSNRQLTNFGGADRIYANSNYKLLKKTGTIISCQGNRNIWRKCQILGGDTIDSDIIAIPDEEIS